MTPVAFPRPTARHRPRGRIRAAVGVGLVVLIFVAVGIPELHVHASHETGLYDEECPLVILSLGPAKAILHDSPNAPHRSTTTGSSLLAPPAVLFALPLVPLRARAPPPTG
jgi:hypothetical protein